jgi:uncharacterized membrane protein
MRHCFIQDKFTEGIGEAVRVIGELLSQHFPRKDRDQNELPDQIIEG